MTFFDVENPYHSSTAGGTGKILRRTVLPGARARLLSTGLLYRRIAIEAPIEAVLEFYGRSVWRDVIRVDNQIVAAKISWWQITPHFRFDLPTGQQPLTVDVRLRLGTFLRIIGFQVTVDDVVVYAEGVFRPWSS